MISEKDALALMDILYPYFIKKYKEDNSFKQTAQIINAIVATASSSTDINSKVEVKINPYDNTTIEVIKGIETSLAQGDSVQIMYYDSLKTARIIAKNS